MGSPQGEDNMVVFGLGCRKLLGGTGWELSLSEDLRYVTIPRQIVCRHSNLSQPYMK